MGVKIAPATRSCYNQTPPGRGLRKRRNSGKRTSDSVRIRGIQRTVVNPLPCSECTRRVISGVSRTVTGNRPFAWVAAAVGPAGRTGPGSPPSTTRCPAANHSHTAPMSQAQYRLSQTTNDPFVLRIENRRINQTCNNVQKEPSGANILK